MRRFIFRGPTLRQERIISKPAASAGPTPQAAWGQRLVGAVLLGATLLLLASARLRAQGMKVIVDQDARGPATTDLQSILVFLESRQFNVLGITTVSGDQWMKEETAHTLRLLEIAGRTDVPVVEGAEFPLLNSKAESERWEALYGKLGYKGCWNDPGKTPAPHQPVWMKPYHPPDVVPPLPEGNPHTKPFPGSAADFIIKMVHRYPGEVTIWAGGPLTNIALALRLDPEVATLARQLVLMGSGMYSDQGGIGGGGGRREFNWWFDPEAVRIVMRSPWKKITITPIDVSVKTRLSRQMIAEIGKTQTPVAQYLAKFAEPEYMWDELAAAALIDPSIITRTQQLYVDIDVSHGPSYGETLFWGRKAELPPYESLATVQFDVNAPKFYGLFVKLMTESPRAASSTRAGENAGR
ncbi:MAG TPA: nucleoside hydrolase [Terriglobia bacterium]|nr:nucleoside hydrolase [Terriglobia bacterium]